MKNCKLDVATLAGLFLIAFPGKRSTILCSPKREDQKTWYLLAPCIQFKYTLYLSSIPVVLNPQPSGQIQFPHLGQSPHGALHRFLGSSTDQGPVHMGPNPSTQMLSEEMQDPWNPVSGRQEQCGVTRTWPNWVEAIQEPRTPFQCAGLAWDLVCLGTDPASFTCTIHLGLRTKTMSIIIVCTCTHTRTLDLHLFYLIQFLHHQ